MNTEENLEPLAERLRPKTLEDFVGQTHLLSDDKPLYKLINNGHIHSMIQVWHLHRHHLLQVVSSQLIDIHRVI